MLGFVGSNCLWGFSVQVGGEAKEEESEDEGTERDWETERDGGTGREEVGKVGSGGDLQEEEEELDDDEGA